MAGLRGFPGVQGGVERHCENLYPRVRQFGFQPCVYARAGYVNRQPYRHAGVDVIPLATIRTAGIEAIAHTGMAILNAQTRGARLLHLHAIGPAIWTPFARRLGMKVVVTHHGFDYNRKKWGDSAKALLRRGENAAIRSADAVICISEEIRSSVAARSPRGIIERIPNGVLPAGPAPSVDLIKPFGLEARKYFLLTARFVEEKGITDLIEAWAHSGLREQCQLVIAGGEDHPSDYGVRVKLLAKEKGACLPGILSGDTLHAMYAHARAFILPSYHEGLPISLLEAMSWGLPAGASSIPANLEVGLETGCYCTPGDRGSIAQVLRHLYNGPDRTDHSSLMTTYDWDAIARSTADLYRRVLGEDVPPSAGPLPALKPRFQYFGRQRSAR
ncbi:MAG: glycosyltransferase family 4 protein [Fibrobacteria bacterium]|nr:glycosyltransferase family 4 protein [Fibrobacteria bacterium]